MTFLFRILAAIISNPVAQNFPPLAVVPVAEHSQSSINPSIAQVQSLSNYPIQEVSTKL